MLLECPSSSRRVIEGMSRGFTIVELLITVAIIGVIAVTGFGYNFFVDSYDLGRETFLSIYIHNNLYDKAMIGIDKMVRGAEDHKGLQESQHVDTPVSGASGDTIVFADGEDVSVTRTIYLSGDDVIYAGGSTETIVDGDVNTLTFSRPSGTNDLININIIMQKVSLGDTITVNLTTSVKLRNVN